MNLSQAQTMANELMGQHGLLVRGWKFRFDRSKKRFGCCFYGKMAITLSSHLTELNDEDRVRNTIIHEIAHVLVGTGHGHDAFWVAKAKEIGCDGERCYNSKEKNTVTVAPRWIGTCPGGHQLFYHRRPKVGRDGTINGRVSCAKCCKDFNPRFKFQWKRASVIAEGIENLKRVA